MIKLAANLSMMFADRPFLQRIDAAADSGFRAVEFVSPYGEARRDVAMRVQKRSLEVALFNFPPGDWAAGERGIAALPDRIEECRAGVATALAYARDLGCSRLHLMAGKIPANVDPDACEATFVDNIAYAAEHCAAQGIDVLLEPINTKIDIPGYFLNSPAHALRLLERVGAPNVRLQYDIYHMQVMEGDLARSIERLLPAIGHIQLADNPGRGEPGTGEINYPWLLARIDALGYDGWIGCEYAPGGETAAGLGWAAPYLG